MVWIQNNEPGTHLVLPVPPLVTYPRDECPICKKEPEDSFMPHGFYPTMKVPNGAWYFIDKKTQHMEWRFEKATPSSEGDHE